jgi:hypothetical protein
MPTKKPSKLSLFFGHSITITKNAVLPSTPTRRKQSRDQHCALIQTLFTLDPETELLRRKGKPISRPDEMTTRRYVCLGYSEFDHRIRYALGHGELPDEIDHGPDHHRDNNWLSNLRPASRPENNRNKPPPTRKPEYEHLARGVYPSGKGFQVRLQDENGRDRNYGTLSTAEEANAVSREVRRKRDREFHSPTPPNHRPPTKRTGTDRG